jgi:hypothetical protein
VPSGGGATPVITGAFGACGPLEAVVSVLDTDQTLVPAMFVLCNSTSYAVKSVRAARVYGLVTHATVVQVPAPAGPKRRLNPVATSCLPSIAGVFQVTVRSLPLPCLSDGAVGGFAVWGGGGGGAGGIFGSMVAAGRNRTMGVGGYIGILARILLRLVYGYQIGGYGNVRLAIFLAGPCRLQ